LSGSLPVAPAFLNDARGEPTLAAWPLTFFGW